MSSSFSECSMSSDTVPFTSAGSRKRVMRMLSTPLGSSLVVPKVLRTRCLPALLVSVMVVSEVESGYLLATKFEHVDVDDRVEMVCDLAGDQRHGTAPRADVKRRGPGPEGILRHQRGITNSDRQLRFWVRSPDAAVLDAER